jgi:tellurite resistance protein TehA-like permease
VTNHDGWILALLVVCAIPANGYAFLYFRRNWWVTEAGRALMVKSLANAGLVDLGLLTEILGPGYPGRPVARAFVFVLFGAGVWYLFIALLRTPRPPRIPLQDALRAWLALRRRH